MVTSLDNLGVMTHHRAAVMHLGVGLLALGAAGVSAIAGLGLGLPLAV